LIIASVAPCACRKLRIETSSGAFFDAYQSSHVLSGLAWLVTVGTYCHGIISRNVAGNGLRGESRHCARDTGAPSSTSV